ncbi:MAG: YfcE family phosphodiesterase [Clostridia bacterium]|nr:YfcE family phosphodiesterase [Clostridia bacterium]
MRLLVFTDSHGRASVMRDAIEKHPEADIIVHLGDCERDADRIEDLAGERPFYRVCGNCDFMPANPLNELIKCGDITVLCTHGHLERVKHGTQMLEEKAKQLGVTVALYGHTHEPDNRYEDGLYIFNPGAAQDGCYGIVDITDKGILCINAEI